MRTPCDPHAQRSAVIYSAPTGRQDLGSGGLAIDLGNRELYVANGQDRSISIIDLAQNVVTATIPVADPPDRLALDHTTKHPLRDQ
ncbi:YncE family protein [Nocardia acidivorans]|uniref:YncE family protein n=1 Tax=Nocardia acidivorans TaxID=404580 RepID=UPI00083130F4|nr:hypothetical protein [Nocardia acidivorans]